MTMRRSLHRGREDRDRGSDDPIMRIEDRDRGRAPAIKGSKGRDKEREPAIKGINDREQGRDEPKTRFGRGVLGEEQRGSRRRALEKVIVRHTKVSTRTRRG
jgi:hypothetical protein